MAAKETKVKVTGDTSKYERAMRDVQARNKRITSTLKKHWVAFSAAAIVAIMALKKAVTAIISSVKDWVNLSKVQELAEINLAAALKAAGEYTDELNLKYQAFASGIQNVTKYGDEQVLTLMALMKNLGVTSGRVEEATKMAIGLATATDRDVKSMSQYVALAMQGEFTMLRRYIPALRATTDKTEQLRIVTEFAARGFKVAQEQTDSFAIGLEQLKNLYGDVKEKLGDIITKNKVVIELMKEAKKWLIATNEQVSEWVKNNKELIEQKTYVAINAIADAAKLAAIAVKALGKSFLVFEKVRTGTLSFWKTTIDYWKEAAGLGARKPHGVTRGWGPAPKPELPLLEDAIPKAAPGFIPTGYWISQTRASEDFLAGEIEREMKRLDFKAEIERNTLEMTRQHYIDMTTLAEENLATEIENLNRAAAAEKAINEMKKEMAKEAAMAMLENWAYAFQELGQKNKQAFTIFKAFAIAQTAIKTIEAAQGAYAALAGIPIVGPALGVAAAAAAYAAGMARVAQISKMQPGATGGGGAGSATPVYAASPTTGLPPIAEHGKEGATINIYVENFVGEDSYIDSFIDKITNRVEVADVNLIATRTRG